MTRHSTLTKEEVILMSSTEVRTHLREKERRSGDFRRDYKEQKLNVQILSNYSDNSPGGGKQHQAAHTL